MLAQAIARQPPPLLACGALRLRRCVGPTAFGNALGNAIVDGAANGASQQAAANRTALNRANQTADPDYYGSGTASSGGASGRWDVPAMDYSLASAGPVRFGTGSVEATPTPEELQAAFRASERGYRQATDEGAEIRAGDTLERLTGGNKEMMGRYRSGMGLRSMNDLKVGQRMVADWSMSAKEAIADADRFYVADAQVKAAAVAAARERSAMSVAWGGELSFDGTGTSFAALGAPTPSMFDDTLPVKVGAGGRIEANLAYAGADAAQVPMAAPPGVDSNFLRYTKQGMLSASQGLAEWGARERGLVGDAALWTGSFLGGTADVLYPGSNTELAAMAIGGPIASKGLTLASSAAVSRFPILGRNVSELWTGASVRGPILVGEGGSFGELAAAGSVRNVNPTGSMQNCTNCVFVVDNQLATGVRASALPRSEPLPFSELNKLYNTQMSGWVSRKHIEATLLDAGNGTRAVIYGMDEAGATAHVWNAVVQRGRINYIDGQVNKGGQGNFDYFPHLRFGITKAGGGN